MNVNKHKYSPSIYTVRLVGDIWSNKSIMQKCCILPECVHFPHQQLGEKGRTELSRCSRKNEITTIPRLDWLTIKRQLYNINVADCLHFYK